MNTPAPWTPGFALQLYSMPGAARRIDPTNMWGDLDDLPDYDAIPMVTDEVSA